MFKEKSTKKKKKLSQSLTLEHKHMQIKKNIDNKRDNLDKLQKKLTKYQSDFKKLESKNIKNIHPNSRIKHLKLKADLADKIEHITESIASISTRNEEMDYLYKAGEHIISYYDSVNSVQKKEKIIVETIDLSQFGKDNVASDSTDDLERENIVKLYDKAIGIRTEKKQKPIHYKNCPECKVELVLHESEGKYTCIQCGYCENIIVNSVVRNYKEPQGEPKGYAYKRINHFREVINQCQGRENTEIPEKVYEDIRVELNKNRLTTTDQITHEVLRTILFKIKYSSYYEHIPYILYKIASIHPPRFTRYQEAKLIKMFEQIQKPFEMFKPPDRKNFLSYYYVLYKFCELLELDNFSEGFKLLKSIANLKEHDQIWKKICTYLEWEFISSM